MVRRVSEDLMSVSMRTEDECLARAADMEWRAGQCGAPDMKAAYLRVAKGWRSVALQARWQDTPRYVDLFSA